MRIAEILVNEQYLSGNKRFFVYIDMDEEKIRGTYTRESIESAIDFFIAENYQKLTKGLMVQKNEKGKKLYNDATARAEIKKRLLLSYVP